MTDLLTAVRGCFAGDYAEARRLFLATCGQTAPRREYTNPNLGPSGETLATDAVWFGPDDADRVLVLVSSTHGAEGFPGSAAQIDWISGGGPAGLPDGIAALIVHAINPHGFAWLRRVTEEGVDLNRNFVDFAEPLPENPGYDELADAFVPASLSGPAFEAAEARIAAYRELHGIKALQIARSGGQYKHPGGVFYGGTGPTWSRRTLERIIVDHRLPERGLVAVVDYHTGLGPFGYGEPICGHAPGSIGVTRAKQWYGDSVTEPALGTSSSVPKVGLSEFGWERLLGDRVTCIALEYGTYPTERGRLVLREDHWLHNNGALVWDDVETRRIKRQIRLHFAPEAEEWREMVLFRSRQILRQAIAGLAGGEA